jgi:hypothetical protein
MTEDSLISVTYLSSAIAMWTEEELEVLLRDVRASNARVDVTGVLLYSGGSFIQTLEGPEAAVEGVLARVTKDPRHQGVLVVLRGEITDRAFAGWSMGFRRISPETAQEIPGFTHYLSTGQMDEAAARADVAATFRRVFRERIHG